MLVHRIVLTFSIRVLLLACYKTLQIVMIKKEIVVTHCQFLAEGDGIFLLRAAASRE